MTETETTRRAVQAQATRVYTSRWTAGGEQTMPVGWAAKVTYSDGTVATCRHIHREATGAQLRACATRLAVTA